MFGNYGTFPHFEMPDAESNESVSDCEEPLAASSWGDSVFVDEVPTAVISSQPLRHAPPVDELAVSMPDYRIDRACFALTQAVGYLMSIKESGREVTVSQVAAISRLEQDLNDLMDTNRVLLSSGSGLRPLQSSIRDLLGVPSLNRRLLSLESWAEHSSPGFRGVPAVDPNSRCACLKRSAYTFRYSAHPCFRMLRRVLAILGFSFVYDWVTFPVFKFCYQHGLDCISVSGIICSKLKGCLDVIFG
ncbi:MULTISPECIES: hypothetical protein [Candidatus Ichthyocystis]|uniref:hypothetical protein n=1 Tax=Candidatus Ichthyocystis TaxID=2929841 RepID=UPI000B84B098|nr:MULTISPECIES: hypothetical protein [Ichthyocystis]